MADASQKQLLASVKNSLTSSAYSDLTITCGSDTYKVHKVIVCERASFFARALKFGGQESQNSTIDLPEDEPGVIKLLVQYLYAGEYEPLLPGAGILGTVRVRKSSRPATSPNGHPYTYAFSHTCSQSSYCNDGKICPHHTCSYQGNATNCNFQCKQFNCKECNPPQLPSLNGNSKQLLTHAKMYEIADKYDVLGLKDLAREKFSRACQHYWDDAEFAVASYHVFSTTPDHDKGMRKVVSATISAHMKLVEKPGVKFLMTEFNGLALGILEEKIKEHGWGKKK